MCTYLQLQLRDPIDSVKHMRKEITLHKCWSTMGNQSHEVCGPKSKTHMKEHVIAK